MNLKGLLLSKIILFGLIGLMNLQAQVEVVCNQNARVTLSSGDSVIVNCLDDDVERVYRLRSRPLTMAFAYLVTDINDIIVGVSTTNFLELEQFGVGAFRVYSFSYYGDVVAQIGENARTSQLGEYCEGLSINFLTVINVQSDGGTVSTTDGLNEIFTCPGDDNADVIEFSSTSLNPFFSYVITDENDQVVEVLSGSSFDFEPLGEGVSRVWGVSHLGELNLSPGEDLISYTNDNDCVGASSNFITVNRATPKAVNVSLTNGSTETEVCISESIGTTLAFQRNGENATPANFVITNENNEVLEIFSGNTIDFPFGEDGVKHVWNVSFTGSLTIQTGDIITQSVLSTDCYELSNNFVTVVQSSVDGGSVSLENATSTATICLNEDGPKELTFTNSSNSDANYTYLVTDDQNRLLALVEGNTFDFGNAEPGDCRVWGLAHAGTLNATIGTDIFDGLISETCFGFSNNFIEVIRQEPVGGTITFADGTTSKIACVGDGNPDVFQFVGTGSTSDSFVYLITEGDGSIIKFSNSTTLNFENSDPGICQIWGLAYFGQLLASAGENLFDVELASGCYELSQSPIEVNRVLVDGGSIALEDGSTSKEVCINDGNADVVTVNAVSDAPNASYGYLLVDENRNLISISLDNLVNLGSSTEGTCQIFGFSYTGDISIQIGDNLDGVAITDGCFDLSDNAISINKTSISGGTIALAGGNTSFSLCPGDSRSNSLEFENEGASGDFFDYLLTDENNIIQAIITGVRFDFEDFPAGNYRVWGLAYSGTLTAAVGQNAATNPLSDDCYALSGNFVEINSIVPVPGEVALDSGENVITICPGDGNADVLTFDTTGFLNTPFVFLITDEDGIVLAIEEGNTFDFEAAPAGICRVYGLSYTGNLTTVVGDNINISFLADDCFEISSNFIEVRRQIPQGGTIQFESGDTSLVICPNDINNFTGLIATDFVGSNFVYLVVDENQSVIAIIDNVEFDFNSLGAGNYEIIGLAFSGALNVSEGSIFDAEADLSSECFDLSNNRLTLTSVTPDAGNIQIAGDPDNSSITICAGTGSTDLFLFESDIDQTALSSIILSTEEDTITHILPLDSVDFTTIPSGSFSVRILSYTGNLTAQIGDEVTSALLADDCFDLSDNFISVSSTFVDGATIGSPSANIENVVFVCDDGEPDVVKFTNTSNAIGESYAYILTNGLDFIFNVVEGDSLDFEGTGFDELKIWGVSYSGNLTVDFGQVITEATLSDDCFDLSDNFITVFSDTPVGGTIATEDGSTALTLCVTNLDSTIALTTTSTAMSGYVYYVADTSGVILKMSTNPVISFSDLAVGLYRIGGVSYTGTLNDVLGANSSEAEFATSCFEVSENTVEVFRAPTLDGGTISFLGESSDTVYTCPGDRRADIVIVQTTSTDPNIQYFLTDENDVVRIPNIGSNVVNFETAGPGIWKIRTISFSGNLELGFGDNVNEEVLSDSCWVLSNPLTVINEFPVGGTIATTDGATEVNIDVTDDIADIVSYETAGASPNTRYTFVITDENNIILGFTNESSFDFSNATPGVCRIWGLAHAGMIIASVGDDAGVTDLAEDCFSLTDNFITVTRGDGPVNNRQEGLNLVQTPQVFNAPDFELSINPNPVKEQVNVRFFIQNATSEEAMVKILNSAGQIIYNSDLGIMEGNNEFSISANNFINGIYLLAIKYEDQLKTIRFVKQ